MSQPDYLERIGELIAEAMALESGPTQVALLERPVQLADLHQDLAAGFETRMHLIDAAMVAGQPQLMLVAFSWCLSQWDRSPEEFGGEPLLWKYRWVVFSLPLFPQVAREQILASMNDMAERYRRVGSSLRGFHLLRRNVAVRMGDRGLGAEAHEVWRGSRRDWLTDSPAQEQDFLVEYLVFCGKHEEAIREAQVLLFGALSRGFEGISTYPELLLSLLRLGQPLNALEYHRAGWKLLAHKPLERFLTECADHLTFLGLTDNWPRGLEIVQKVLPAALATASQFLRFDFYLACFLFFDRLAERANSSVPGKTIGLRLPQSFPLWSSADEYEVAGLAQWFGQQSHELAKAFDARNGNTFFQDRLDELPALKKLATPCLLPERRTNKR